MKNKKKKFLITIDTEGDNLWEWKIGKDITTRNAYYLERFQDLCSQYDYKPVWLSNWEMINDSFFSNYINKCLEEKKCELGMHLHAWNNPPYYELPYNKKSGAPYLIEYPEEIMEEKIAFITKKMKEKFGFVPVSHRAGRWAMNDTYFKLLYKYGYRIDCSYTPGIDWTKSFGQTPGFLGPNYQGVNKKIHMKNGITEVPVSVEYSHRFFWDKHNTFKSNIKSTLYGVRGKNIWLRPEKDNMKEMEFIIEKKVNSDDEYLMFMLHSSEMMPGGSPTFQSQKDIEELYDKLEDLFQKISIDFSGATLEEYVRGQNENRDFNIS